MNTIIKANAMEDVIAAILGSISVRMLIATIFTNVPINSVIHILGGSTTFTPLFITL